MRYMVMRKVFAILLLMFVCSGFVIRGELPERGYRGFVESENFFFPDLGFLVGGGGDSDFWTGFSTTHGYQFGPHIFVGLGMSCLWMLNDNDYNNDAPKVEYLPLFADIRSDMCFGRFTPFVDLRMGCNLLRHGAFSSALALGYRFDWGRRFALNLAMGLNLRGRRYEDYDSGWNSETGQWSKPNGRYRTGYDAKPVLRLGIEF